MPSPSPTRAASAKTALGDARALASDGVPDAAALITALFAATAEAILVGDDDRRNMTANPAACDLLGRRPDEILNLRVDDIAPPASTAWLSDSWAAF